MTDKDLLQVASSALRKLREVYVFDVNEDGEPNAEVLDILALWNVVGGIIKDIEKQV